MIIRLAVLIILWLFIFTFRVIQTGGIDPTYKDSETELFLPLRNHLVSVADRILPSPQSALLSGIILGSQEKLPFNLKKQLQATSTVHIVVVSGQNLTILAGFFLHLASLLGRKKTLIFTFAAIIFYSFLTGLQVPVIRAAIMVILTYFAQILGREKTGWWVLFLTAGLMLIYNPNWLLNISFQLSFLATFGVVIIAPILIHALKVVPVFLREDLAVTLAAQLMVMPIIAYNFYQVSLIGILVNSLILWSIPIIMVSGFAALIFGIVSNLMGQLAGLVPSLLLTYFIYLVQFFSKIPGASFKIGETGVMLWMGYYLFLGGVLLILSRSRNKLI